MDSPLASPPYDDVAEVYDLLTASQQHAVWLGRIEQLARRFGLTGNRVLDVACGTGKSFLPLLARGYRVVASDLSPGMVERARAAAAGRAEVAVADMRHLPMTGPHDLVTCLNDAVNHLDDLDQVSAFFEGARANLAPGGLLVFDATTALTYVDGRDAVTEDDEHVLLWRGSQTRLDEFGAATMRVDVFKADSEGGWSRRRFVQRQQIHPTGEIRRALGESGMRLIAARGQMPGGRLRDDFDVDLHPKILFLAGRFV